MSRDEWHYVTYTVNNNGIVVYSDGNELGRADKDITICIDNDILSSINTVMVGAGPIWGDVDVADAKFDNVAFYNKALTAGEVVSLYGTEGGVLTEAAPIATL